MSFTLYGFWKPRSILIKYRQTPFHRIHSKISFSQTDVIKMTDFPIVLVHLNSEFSSFDSETYLILMFPY